MSYFGGGRTLPEKVEAGASSGGVVERKHAQWACLLFLGGHHVLVDDCRVTDARDFPGTARHLLMTAA